MANRKKILQRIESYYESYYRMDKLYYKWAAKHNIRDTTLFVLDCIYRNPKYCTQKSICEELGYPKQTVSFALKRLEGDGIITREKDNLDSRGNIVHFTEYGRQYAKQLLDAMREAECRAFASMTEEEQETAIRGMKLLSEALKNSFENME